MNRAILFPGLLRMRASIGSALSPVLLAGICLACDLNVRETGFLNNAGGPYYPMQYRLIMIAAAESPETRQLADALAKIEKAELQESNLGITLFTADKISARDRALMKEDGVDLEKIPQTFLFVQNQFERKILFTENRLFTVEDVRALAVSPAKKNLQGMLANNDHYCVAVLIAGSDKKATSQAEKAIQAGIKVCAPRLMKQKIAYLKVDKGDRDEKRFLQELELAAGTEPACAMIFGKGRMVVPMLKGAEITSERIEEMFSFLQANASDCTPDAVYLPGSVVDMILPWSDKLDAKMYEAIAKSGVIPDLAWTEAEIDPNTGEVIDKQAK